MAGAISEDNREVWVPSPALGAVHYTEWRLPAEDTMKQLQMSVVQKTVHFCRVNQIVILLFYFVLQSRE